MLSIFIVGAVGGVLSGMLGVGGAVILLPLLTALGGLTIKEASNVTIVQVVAAALISLAVYNRARLVHLPLALHMGAGSLIGGLAGGFGSQALPVFALEWLFLLVVLIAIALLFIPVREARAISASAASALAAAAARAEAAPTVPTRPPDLSWGSRWLGALRGALGNDPRLPPFNRAQAVALGLSVGALAGTLGAGGGFLIVPLMIGALRLPTRLAIGSSPVVILISSIAGFAGKLAAHQIQFAPAAALVAGAVPATYLGTQIGRRLSPRFLRFFLGGMLALIALRGGYTILSHLA